MVYYTVHKQTKGNNMRIPTVSVQLIRDNSYTCSHNKFRRKVFLFFLFFTFGTRNFELLLIFFIFLKVEKKGKYIALPFKQDKRKLISSDSESTITLFMLGDLSMLADLSCDLSSVNLLYHSLHAC